MHSGIKWFAVVVNVDIYSSCLSRHHSSLCRYIGMAPAPMSLSLSSCN